MAKVTCEQHFFDMEANHPRMVGDSFKTSNDRAKMLESKGLVIVVEMEEETDPVNPPQNKVVKPSKKK
jgi:hypothetical protein